MLTKTKPGAGAGGDAAKKGGTSKQTAVGVDVRNLEDEDSDARYSFGVIHVLYLYLQRFLCCLTEGISRMSLPTVSQDLRIAIAQARQAKGLSQKDLAAKLMIPAKVLFMNLFLFEKDQEFDYCSLILR